MLIKQFVQGWICWYIFHNYCASSCAIFTESLVQKYYVECIWRSFLSRFTIDKLTFIFFLPTFAHAALPTGCLTLSWITCLCGSGRLSWCSRLLCRLCRTKRGGFHDEGHRLCRVWAGRACRTCNDLNECVIMYTYSWVQLARQDDRLVDHTHRWEWKFF